MPQVKKSENWDSVAAPALPGGWHADPGFQTSNSLFRSAPNSLRYLYPGEGGFLYWSGTTDNFGGNARVKADVYFGGLAVQQQWQLLLRYDPVGLNGYAVVLEPAGSLLDGISLWKELAGGYFQLGSTFGAGQIAVDAWYTLQLRTSNTAISALVQRVSDGYWLNGLAGWVPYPVVAMVATDSSITGAGYAALAANQNAAENNPLYSDNFLFEDQRPDTGILLKRRKRPAVAVPVKKKRKRGWQWFSPVLKPPPPNQAQWFQASQDSFCGLAQACQPFAPGPLSIPCLIRYGVQGGPVVALNENSSVVHVSEPAAAAPWPPGTWVVRLNIQQPGTTAWVWDSVYICRVNTACANQNTIASATGLNLDVSQPGIYGVSLQGLADTNAVPTDSFYIVYGLLSHGPPGQSTNVKLDQPIDTPFTYFGGVDQYVPDRIGLNRSWQQRTARKVSTAVTRRKYRIPPNLLIPQPPQTGPFHASLFRRRRRRVWEERQRGNNPYPRAGAKQHKGGSGIVPIQSPLPVWPAALFPRPRHRRPLRPVPRYRRLARWLPLSPIFLGSDKAMIATALVEENLQAAALTTENLPGSALVVEPIAGNASIILGDVLRKQSPTTR